MADGAPQIWQPAEHSLSDQTNRYESDVLMEESWESFSYT